ncbi:hypothetical protein [Aureibaculum luteum]|uniref:hypothetical protein n=1 Tax=Aureibaculum luteum TaxID=1548456 RepID=UPI0013002504|nr:hypothetical protein [Aureibaculum luteum]
MIRTAYNCGPGGADGRAEAKIYHKMEQIENAIKERASIDSNGGIEYIYRSASINVSMNIYDALIKVVDDFYFTDENKKMKKRLEKLATDIYI